ncbi:tRNA U34 5-methylaminomethyl-2-thiouridine-forming methyltransferase MnmC [Zhouia amylolytica]|uniref:tRNA U34 5-methylaminomethyl-2-thiouridine-forming methyltransferase MnmC n=1 Tax=Zhouia amylolytica TaxID=376730 RepID=A0A1I6RSB2_9FLAO|nr:tRNA (5-methylaminomethyl-2-thiouridine)(34)-methyltransferase MnmD [Zhouia amylolytica]SFS67609.1 tRNA U34 5-methylaminomethyl-2-thiouridine-forming methyltransferase MnmC [Zhouia amylolytica]
MKRRVIKTADGSSTIFIEDWDENYHSKHGAIQEAYHVFLKMGLYHHLEQYNVENEIKILEIGFGTGLNALITYLEAVKNNLFIDYHGVEGYPVLAIEVEQLNYIERLSAQNEKDQFKKMHETSWDEYFKLSDQFRMIKRKQFFNEIDDQNVFDLIYFDAFGARVQPELWTEEIFQRMYNALKSGGVLVTYAAKGSVRRAMIACGFSVEKLPGPPGKREMLRATK